MHRNERMNISQSYGQNDTKLKMVNKSLTTNIDSIEKKRKSVQKMQMQHEMHIQDLVERETQLNSYANQLLAKSKDVNRKTKEIKSIRDTKLRKYHDERQNLKRKLDHIERKIATFEANIKTLTQQKNSLIRSIESSKNQLDVLSQVSERHSFKINSYNSQSMNDINDIKSQMQQLRHQIDNFHETKSKLQSKIRTYENRIDELQQKKAEIMINVHFAQDKLNHQKAERDRVIKRIQGMYQESSTLFSQYKQIEIKFTSKQAILLNRIQTLHQKANDMTMQLDEIELNKKKLKTMMVVSDSDLTVTKQNLSTLNEALPSLLSDTAIQQNTSTEISKHYAHINIDHQKAQAELKQAQECLKEEQAKLKKYQSEIKQEEIDMNDLFEVYGKIHLEEEKEESLIQKYQTMKLITLESDLKTIDTTSERIDSNSRIRSLQREIDTESNSLTDLKRNIRMLSQSVDSSQTEIAQIQDEIQHCLTIPTELYSPTLTSPKGFQSTKAIQYELNAREEERNRLRKSMQASYKLLEDRCHTYEIRISTRKEKIEKQKRSMEVTKSTVDLNNTSNASTEKQLALNSLHDVSRIVNDELQNWSNLRMAVDIVTLLKRWDNQINTLFIDIDGVFLS